MKTLRLFHTAVIGGLGGLVSWSFLQIFFYAENIIGPFPLLDQFVYQGMVVGVGIGIFICSRENILSENFHALKTSAFAGAGIGLISGLFAFVIGQSLLAFPTYMPFSWIRLVSWTLFGFWLGVIANLAAPASRRSVSQIIGALLGGLLGGLSFEAYQLLQVEYFSDLLSLVFIGMILSLSLVFIDTCTSKAYLRILTGGSEGKIFLLDKKEFALGYNSQNDIVLRGYSEVCGTHAQIIQSSLTHQIVNVCSGGQVLVNYRYIDQQSMKNGDIIKLGTALLQYCEVP
ncbi:MAG: FHA domain-containing protein [SAR324 cluster bacterium]|nr:FHA domain-containing protein [SAR324 cluster bacterium]